MIAAPHNLHSLVTTEAAVVAGVGVREVDRAIDEKLLPEDFLGFSNPSRGKPRRELCPISCLFISFYYGTEKQLTSSLRRSLMAPIRSKLVGSSTFDITHDLLTRSWIIEQDEVTLNLRRYAIQVVHGMDCLIEAREQITSDAAVMGGADVIKGTRIMVRNLAASMAAGRDPKDILLDYENPALTERHLELAALYAKAYPLRGRPPLAGVLKENGFRKVASFN